MARFPKQRLALLLPIAASLALWSSRYVYSQSAAGERQAPSAVSPSAEGPGAAMAFEKSFRGEGNSDTWKPIPFEQCSHITPLTEELWSKKHVLTDFKRNRTPDQIGVIVFVKTEYCCDGSRLCAVTTACMEKKSTPLIGRFRVYGGWIKNHPDYREHGRAEWDQQVIHEYGFVQGPGARVVVMVPTFDGLMYQWFSNASELELSLSEFERDEGRTPALEKFLAEAVKYAPSAKAETESIGE
ncbi:MAG: hypothetical protein KatS3mg082_2030 [Nitrospiraceae bacterium]|nr:MAG: hypothetical protein KatS3mg082_2030 [Nitrospiraceae bacterium]